MWFALFLLAAPETPEQIFTRLTKRPMPALTVDTVGVAAKDGDAIVRFAAAAAASRLTKNDGLAATLAPLLTDKEAETRAMAAKAMAKHGAAPETFLPLLTDKDWRVRVEGYRGALSGKAPVAQVASLVAKTWLEAKPIDAHPLLVAFEQLWAFAKEREARALFDMVYEQAKTATDVDRKRIGCLAAFGRLKGGSGTLNDVLACADADRGAALAAQAIEEGLGAPADKTAVLQKLWAHPLERVRASAGAAAVFSKSPLVVQALNAKQTSIIAFAADAMARYAREGTRPAGLSTGKKPLDPAWLTAAVKRLDDPALEVDAKLSILDAVTAAVYKPALAACQKALTHPSLRGQAETCVAALSTTKPASQPASEPVQAPVPFEPLKGKTRDLRVTTSRGAFTIRVDGRVAPFAAGSFVSLAEKKFFDAQIVHRVVANFVIQSGDPSGTGTASAGYTLPAEPSASAFSRGAVGIADSGPGTGGSQWFVMHSRAPHLEGRYTWVGTVTDGMDVVDKIQVGDVIVSIEPAK